MNESLPFDAERSPAKERRFKETVVFVHHFGGDRRTVLRHVKMVNDLGFDAVRFNLLFNKMVPLEKLPITGDLKLGARHIWAGQIESLLNAIPGRKIVYSFSMPSNGALEAIARRRGEDIAAWICDGGPFLQIMKCTWNLFEHEYGVTSRLLRGVYTALSYVIFGYGAEEDAERAMAALPTGFPILSIRGERDPLVPPSAIDEVFDFPTKAKIETLSFKDGRHLDALKAHPNEYTERVAAFIKAESRP